LQRFVSELADPRFFSVRNRIAGHVRTGAESIWSITCGLPKVLIIYITMASRCWRFGGLALTTGP
jgi:hypothetical protein